MEEGKFVHLINEAEAKSMIKKFGDQHPHRTKAFSFFSEEEIDALLAESGNLNVYNGVKDDGEETVILQRGSVLLEKAQGCPPNCLKSLSLL